MEISNILATVPLFQGLSPEQLQELGKIVTTQDCRRGQIIFSEGDEAVGFYLVISGMVKIFKLSPDGKEQVLHFLGPGEPFAEVAVFAGFSYPANALALEASRILFVPKAGFMELLQQSPSLAMNMLASLSMRLRKFSLMIEDLSLKEVPGRLAAHLLYLSSQQNDTPELQLKIGKAQLAGLLGTIPETLSRILTKMTKQGLIESSGSTIKILDREELEYLAAGDKRLS